MTARTCAADGCTTTLGAKNKSGFCKGCFNRQRASCPKWRAAIGEAKRIQWQDPAFRARCLANLAEVRARPETIEARRAAIRLHKPWIKGNQAMPKGSEPRMRAGAHASATKLAHVPTDMRPLYRHLTHSKNYTADEALKIVLEQAEVERRRIRAELGEAA